MFSPKKLDIYEDSLTLAQEIYRCTESFPGKEIFGITKQLRNAVSSVGANIAEGCGRPTENDFLRFIGIASASLVEVQYFLELSFRLNYLKKQEYDVLYSKAVILCKRINAFYSKTKTRAKWLSQYRPKL